MKLNDRGHHKNIRIRLKIFFWSWVYLPRIFLIAIDLNQEPDTCTNLKSPLVSGRGLTWSLTLFLGMQLLQQNVVFRKCMKSACFPEPEVKWFLSKVIVISKCLFRCFRNTIQSLLCRFWNILVYIYYIWKYCRAEIIKTLLTVYFRKIRDQITISLNIEKHKYQFQFIFPRNCVFSFKIEKGGMRGLSHPKIKYM